MLAGAILIAGLIFGPPASESAEAPKDPRDPIAEAEAEPGPETHGQLELHLLARGRRDPIPGARVIPVAVEGEEEAVSLEPAETDAEGKLELWLEPGPHRFAIRAEGYEPQTLELEVVVGERQAITLRVDEAIGGNRFRTVVETDRRVAVHRTRLRDEEIHALPGTGGDPLGVVKSLPGAAQVAGFLPYVVVRGAAPGNTGYYLDGVRVPLLFHVAAGPSVIHPYFIDEVDFYPGGVPVRLGRYASGIVEGRTAKPGRDRVRGEVDLRLTDAGALLEIPFDRERDRDCELRERAEIAGEDGELTAKQERRIRRACRGTGRGSLALAGRYSYTGLILSAIPALNIKLRFWDYQARLDHDLGPRARYTAFVFGAYDELGPRQAIVEEVDEDSGLLIQRVDDDPPPYLRFEFHRIDQRIRQRLSGGGRVDYKLALGLDRSGVQDVRVDEWRVAPRVDARLPINDRLELGLGLDQEFQVFRLPAGLGLGELGTNVEDLALLLSERFVSVTGLYAELAYKKGAVEVRPGVRGDLWAQVGVSPYLPQARTRAAAVGVDPRLLLRERVGERWTLRQSIGVYHQPPDPPLPIPGIESIGLQKGLQRNVQASFGWQWQLFGRAVLTQDAYVGRLANMQDYELSQGLDNSNPSNADEFEDYIIQVSGWAWGLETMLRLIPDGRVYGWLAYTLSWSVRDYPLGGFAPATWDQRHLLNAVLGWKVNRKWRIGGRLHVNSGRPYTARRTLADNSLESLPDALADHRNDSRLPAFMQLDVRVERIFTLDDFRLHLYLDLANANFGREVLRCDSLADSNNPQVAVVDGCVNPQALRYVIPALGLRAVF